jgi:hypothetical protein
MRWIYNKLLAMAIKSTKDSQDTERVVSTKEKDNELQSDIKLRPKKIEDYI